MAGINVTAWRGGHDPYGLGLSESEDEDVEEVRCRTSDETRVATARMRSAKKEALTRVKALLIKVCVL